MRPVAEVVSYHAHVYFESGQQAQAARVLREAVAERFAVRLGTWHDRPVGPHSQAMYQIAFTTDLFATLVPWLMLNHGELSILVHPNTGSPRQDHVRDRLWIGQPLAIIENVLPEREERPEEAGKPNTAPSVAP
jgi:aromatic ring-cleaving dioxygenase